MTNSNTDKGSLMFNVYHTGQSRPATGIKIRIKERGSPNIIDELVTDFSGQTEIIELPAPPVEFSMKPGMLQPYSEYEIICLIGNETVYEVKNAQIYPGTTAAQDIILARAGSSENTVNVDAPVLYGNYPPKIPEDETKKLPRLKGFAVLPEPVIPEYIIVHAGKPDNRTAKNYRIKFKDYIKNTASSEIYATWPAATIRANVLAIISFTLNRVYTEWYRSKGYDFTITNSTAYDQAFSYGRTIYREISTIVDEMFTTYITKANIRQPLLIQYCNEDRVSCSDRLTQWGSKDLGDKGYSTAEILKHFYGNEIYLAQAKKVAGVPRSYPGYDFTTGAKGRNVRIMQEQLNAVSDNFPAIKKLKIDGIFGPATSGSLQSFQRIFRLPITGIVDFSTWYRISDIYLTVAKTAESR